MAESLATEQTKPNQSFLSSFSFGDDTLETMIEVDQVSMIFNMAAEQLNSLKEYAISLARHELKFKEFRALDNISLTVKRGDVFGIMGTNGSGKSTLLKIIAGVLDPSEGTCTINGSIAPLIELGAGFDLELTARENIYLNGALLGYPKEFIDQHFEEIVNFAEIRAFLDMPMKNYSSGMVARVAFAIATVIVPDILIVDEVLSVGDFMFQQKCERRIQSLIRDYGVTVLIVSHNSDQIERLCNKAIWIEKGHTRMIGPADEVSQLYRILGGRKGSDKAEKTILDLYEQSFGQNTQSPLMSIFAHSSYELSKRLYMRDGAERNTLVLSYGNDFATSFLATNLASAINADNLNINEEFLDTELEQIIKDRKYEQAIILQDRNCISKVLKDYFARLIPNTAYEELSNNRLSSLSRMALHYAKNDGVVWSKTALLCAPHNHADLISISPFLFANNIPVFFIDEAGTIPLEILDEVNTFDALILLGGSISFPESCLSNLSQKITITRLYGDGPYDAYLKINTWVKKQHGYLSPENKGICIASFTDIEGIPSAGLFAQRHCENLQLYSDQNTDSIATIIERLQDNKVDSEHLHIIGLTSSLNNANNELFSKAVLNAQEHPSSR